MWLNGIKKNAETAARNAITAGGASRTPTKASKGGFMGFFARGSSAAINSAAAKLTRSSHAEGPRQSVHARDSLSAPVLPPIPDGELDTRLDEMVKALGLADVQAAAVRKLPVEQKREMLKVREAATLRSPPHLPLPPTPASPSPPPPSPASPGLPRFSRSVR